MLDRLPKVNDAPRRGGGATTLGAALSRMRAHAVRDARVVRIRRGASRRGLLVALGWVAALAVIVGAALHGYRQLSSARTELSAARAYMHQAGQQQQDATAGLLLRLRRELTDLRAASRAELRTLSAGTRMADEAYEAATRDRLLALERAVERQRGGTPGTLRARTLADDFRQAYARARGAVLFIRVGYRVRMAQSGEEQELTSFGTGFLISPQGMALTAQHVLYPWRYDRRLQASAALGMVEVLEDTHSVTVWTAESQVRENGSDDAPLLPQLGFRLGEGRRELEILHAGRADPRTEVLNSPMGPVQLQLPPLGRGDLVVFQLIDAGRVFPHVPLEEAAEPAPLDDVLVVGFPLSRLQAGRAVPQVTSGRVRRAGSEVLELDAALHPGNSGGPVLDRAGRVVGLASAILDSPVYGIAVRGAELHAGLRAARAAVAAEQRRLRTLGCDPGTPDGILGRRTLAARRCAQRLAAALHDATAVQDIP